MMGRTKRQQGAILALMVVIGVIVAIVGMAMIQLGYHARKTAVRNVQTLSARCAADAGLAEALYKMQQTLVSVGSWTSPPPSITTNVPLPASPALYRYTITGGPTTGFQIDATGTCGPMFRMTHAKAKVGSYWKGIGVEKTVVVDNKPVFQVYDPIGSGDTLEIRSNSTDRDTMIFKAVVTVPGDVVAGPGVPESAMPDVINTKDKTVIMGECYSAPQTLVFPPVSAPFPPDYLEEEIKTTTSMPLPPLTTTGVHQYPAIQMPNSGILQINAPVADINFPVVVYVQGDMGMNTASQVVVEPGSAVAVYLGGNLTNNNSVGFINNTNDPRRLKIYGLPTCLSIDLKNSSEMFAAIYAPSADITMFNSAGFSGAITGKSLTLKESGIFQFDTRLQEVNINDPAAMFVIDRWWEN